jgi:hypothetical protein
MSSATARRPSLSWDPIRTPLWRLKPECRQPRSVRISVSSIRRSPRSIWCTRWRNRCSSTERSIFGNATNQPVGVNTPSVTRACRWGWKFTAESTPDVAGYPETIQERAGRTVRSSARARLSVLGGKKSSDRTRSAQQPRRADRAHADARSSPWPPTLPALEQSATGGRRWAVREYEGCSSSTSPTRGRKAA